MELLVVIAIIGVLAGIVLVSLTGARNRAKDTRIQADLTQVRSIAELIYDAEPATGYTNLCSGGGLNAGHSLYGSQLGTIATDISTQNGGVAPTCAATSSQYCVSAKLASGGYACISDAGSLMTTSTDPCTSWQGCH